MELKLLWRILKRRWWLPTLIVLLVLASILMRPSPPPTYVASLRFLVGVQPEPLNPDVYGYDRYYTWLTSEYLIDDFSEVVRGSEFAARVSARLKERGITVPPGAIQGSTQTGKLHRLITITITWGNPEELRAIANAVITAVQEDGPRFFPEAFGYGVTAILVDGPHIGPVVPGLRARLDAPIRLILALLVGIGLVLLWHYVDDTLYDTDDVTALGLTVIAEIPR